MATLAEVAAYRTNLERLSSRAVADLGRALKALEGRPPIEVRNSLIALFPDLINPYITLSGELAATWYEDLRSRAFPTPFYATTSGEVNKSRIASLVRWGVKPLFGYSDSTPLSLLGGGVQRMIADASRDTINLNAKRDKETTSWSRVARPDACEFCTMLAGRGPVYRSESAASMTIGAGVDPSRAFNEDGSRKVGGIGGGVKARGSRAVGVTQYHDDCHCTVVPTFYRVSDERRDFGRGPENFLIPFTE